MITKANLCWIIPCRIKTGPLRKNLKELQFNNLLLTWMLIENNVTGALIAINKNEGSFSEEDSEIVGILANNMNAALDNIGLFNNLQQQMVEQKKNPAPTFRSGEAYSPGSPGRRYCP